jgi:hypothetical protein
MRYIGPSPRSPGVELLRRVIAQVPGLGHYFKDDAVEQVAKDLFEDTFPEYRGKRVIEVPSPSVAGLNYAITPPISGIRVEMAGAIGSLCIGDTLRCPTYDNVVQLVLLLKNAERRVWREAFFHGSHKEWDGLVARMGGRFWVVENSMGAIPIGDWVHDWQENRG